MTQPEPQPEPRPDPCPNPLPPNPWVWALLIGAGGTLTGFAVIAYAIWLVVA